MTFSNPVKRFTCISRCLNALTCFDVPTRTISYMRASFTQDGGWGIFQQSWDEQLGKSSLMVCIRPVHLEPGLTVPGEHREDEDV